MAREKPAGKNEDWAHLIRVGALVGGVLITLTLGAALDVGSAESPQVWTEVATATPVESDPAALPADEPYVEPAPPPAATPAPAIAEPEPPVRTPARTAAQPAVSPDPRDAGLARRVAEGLTLADDAAWTLQFLYTCEPAKAERLLNEVGGDARLHLLRPDATKPDCLRVCWGRYPDRDTAVAAEDVPAALRTLSASPIPRKLADLLP